nr:MAG TPA: hypothetical protein [Bacteriophage sp.]
MRASIVPLRPVARSRTSCPRRRLSFAIIITTRPSLQIPRQTPGM